jgi:hypothetical protein
LVGRPEGGRPLGRPECIIENNIKMDLREEGWGMDYIDLAQIGTGGGLMNLQVP